MAVTIDYCYPPFSISKKTAGQYIDRSNRTLNFYFGPTSLSTDTRRSWGGSDVKNSITNIIGQTLTLTISYKFPSATSPDMEFVESHVLTESNVINGVPFEIPSNEFLIGYSSDGEYYSLTITVTVSSTEWYNEYIAIKDVIHFDFDSSNSRYIVQAPDQYVGDFLNKMSGFEVYGSDSKLISTVRDGQYTSFQSYSKSLSGETIKDGSEYGGARFDFGFSLYGIGTSSQSAFTRFKEYYKNENLKLRVYFYEPTSSGSGKCVRRFYRSDYYGPLVGLGRLVYKTFDTSEDSIFISENPNPSDMSEYGAIHISIKNIPAFEHAFSAPTTFNNCYILIDFNPDSKQGYDELGWILFKINQDNNKVTQISTGSDLAGYNDIYVNNDNPLDYEHLYNFWDYYYYYTNTYLSAVKTDVRTIMGIPDQSDPVTHDVYPLRTRFRIRHGFSYPDAIKQGKKIKANLTTVVKSNESYLINGNVENVEVDPVLIGDYNTSTFFMGARVTDDPVVAVLIVNDANCMFSKAYTTHLCSTENENSNRDVIKVIYDTTEMSTQGSVTFRSEAFNYYNKNDGTIVEKGRPDPSYVSWDFSATPIERPYEPDSLPHNTYFIESPSLIHEKKRITSVKYTPTINTEDFEFIDFDSGDIRDSSVIDGEQKTIKRIYFRFGNDKPFARVFGPKETFEEEEETIVIDSSQLYKSIIIGVRNVDETYGTEEETVLTRCGDRLIFAPVFEVDYGRSSTDTWYFTHTAKEDQTEYIGEGHDNDYINHYLTMDDDFTISWHNYGYSVNGFGKIGLGDSIYVKENGNMVHVNSYRVGKIASYAHCDPFDIVNPDLTIIPIENDDFSVKYSKSDTISKVGKLVIFLGNLNVEESPTEDFYSIDSEDGTITKLPVTFTKKVGIVNEEEKWFNRGVTFVTANTDRYTMFLFPNTHSFGSLTGYPEDISNNVIFNMDLTKVSSLEGLSSYINPGYVSGITSAFGDDSEVLISGGKSEYYGMHYPEHGMKICYDLTLVQSGTSLICDHETYVHNSRFPFILNQYVLPGIDGNICSVDPDGTVNAFEEQHDYERGKARLVSEIGGKIVYAGMEIPRIWHTDTEVAAARNIQLIDYT